MGCGVHIQPYNKEWNFFVGLILLVLNFKKCALCSFCIELVHLSGILQKFLHFLVVYGYAWSGLKFWSMVHQFFNLHFVHAITLIHISIIIQNEVEFIYIYMYIYVCMHVCVYVFKINDKHRKQGKGWKYYKCYPFLLKLIYPWFDRLFFLEEYCIVFLTELLQQLPLCRQMAIFLSGYKGDFMRSGIRWVYHVQIASLFRIFV